MNVVCCIPHYGDDQLLRECICGVENVSKYDDIDVEIRVCDNNKYNVLFTKGINKCITGKHDNKSGFINDDSIIWILNNDCIAQPGCISEALKCFNDIKDCGIVGSQNRLLSDPNKIFWGGSFECFPGGVHKQGFANKNHLQRRSEEVWATFSSVFIRSEVIKNHGLLDENMLHICSDAAYCINARVKLKDGKQWKTFHEPKSIVHHRVGSAGRGSNKLGLIVLQDTTYFFYHFKPILQALYGDAISIHEENQRLINERNHNPIGFHMRQLSILNQLAGDRSEELEKLNEKK